ncbi:endonuclease/exonuclease/phosphatase family protein [Halpernia frigidisoli]|uniref:Endonuclease/Exonuclease/phosphatase family protein n=1 Tax=Halpernia frigidisoli TaxID=1125876 RepID=A0A1I3J281_9FLAO|nr:endonuclease/exonuclease/phosphatase family protein [Halpernia frigidisoli]SFI54344.1 Endonuclease/Exonuclease/phosphatase family protein [Halpernia frigidisoli]
MNNDASAELIMFYNVENLFPPDPKPVHKSDPSNSGLKNWDENRYKSKITKIAHVLELVTEDHQILPILIGLAEISTDSVLKDIIAQPVFENKYKYIQFDSLDERGVDVALLYNAEKCEILHSEPISFIFEFENPGPSSFDTTRDVLFCKVKIDEQIIDFYVVHLPSKRENDVNKPKREHILDKIKERILEERKENSDPVIVMGDFNDNANEVMIDNFLKTNDTEILKNPFSQLFLDKKYSTFHHSNGLLFEQILLSLEFFNNISGLKFEEAAVFNNVKLGSWDRKYQGRPFRTYVGTRYLGGYSDHFPVLVKIKNI